MREKLRDRLSFHQMNHICCCRNLAMSAFNASSSPKEAEAADGKSVASSSKDANAAGEKQPIAKSTAPNVDDNEEEPDTDIMQMFAEETTFPGIPRVILAKSKVSKYFWLLICVTCAICFGAGIFELLARYFMYEKKVCLKLDYFKINRRALGWLSFDTANPSICLCVASFVCLFVCLSVCLPVRSSVTISQRLLRKLTDLLS